MGRDRYPRQSLGALHSRIKQVGDPPTSVDALTETIYYSRAS